MLRMLLLIIGGIIVVFLALAVVRTFFWLTLIALIVIFVGFAFGLFHRGRRRRERDNRYRRRPY
jgi:uncharacterized membrane protein